MLEKLPAGLGQALRGLRPGLEKSAWEDERFQTVPNTLMVKSSAFDDSQPLPKRHTSDGGGVSPPLSWSGAPQGAASVALLVEDVDSPTPSPLVHAVAWNLPPEGELSAAELAKDTSGPSLGWNSFGRTGWLAPDPPPGHGPHRYVFQLFALDRTLEIEKQPDRGALLRAMDGAVLAKGRLIGSYERS